MDAFEFGKTNEVAVALARAAEVGTSGVGIAGLDIAKVGIAEAVALIEVVDVEQERPGLAAGEAVDAMEVVVAFAEEGLEMGIAAVVVVVGVESEVLPLVEMVVTFCAVRWRSYATLSVISCMVTEHQLERRGFRVSQELP